MATINQLVRKPRKRKVQPSDVRALQACPQRRGVCTRVYTTLQTPNCRWHLQDRLKIQPAHHVLCNHRFAGQK